MRSNVSAASGRSSKSSRHSQQLNNSSNGGLPGYIPSGNTPPPAYDSAIQQLHNIPKIPSIFRPQNIADIRNMNFELYVSLKLLL